MAARVLQQPMQAAFADTSGGSGSESDIETIEDTINRIDNYLNKSPKIVRKKAKLIDPYKLRYTDILIVLSCSRFKVEFEFSILFFRAPETNTLTQLQLEMLLEVKYIVDHKSVKSGVSFLASLYYAFIWKFFGIPSVQQAYSVIISYIARTEQFEAMFVNRFLIDFHLNEVNYYNKTNKLTRFRNKNREDFLKIVCKAKSLNFIFEKRIPWFQC